MKKTFKKIISLVLVLVMLMSVGAVFASAEAATEEPAPENHGSFISIFMGFIMEFYGLLKYIFHDVWLGKPPV